MERNNFTLIKLSDKILHVHLGSVFQVYKSHDCSWETEVGISVLKHFKAIYCHNSYAIGLK